jgi:hypothetical protein
MTGVCEEGAGTAAFSSITGNLSFRTLWTGENANYRFIRYRVPIYPEIRYRVPT